MIIATIQLSRITVTYFEQLNSDILVVYNEEKKWVERQQKIRFECVQISFAFPSQNAWDQQRGFSFYMQTIFQLYPYSENELIILK